jgi:lactobin A/cerein 7B family class IIb bacteriocin
MTTVALRDGATDMRELSADELDQVEGGILPIIAGVAVGVIVGTSAVVGAVLVADGIAHLTGSGCFFDNAFK